MADLRNRFGRLLAAHRRAKKLTQAELAERAEISVDMVTKLETGASGARFPVIERLATVLEVDPAEFFTTEIRRGALSRAPLIAIETQLATLNDNDLIWIAGVIEAALSQGKR